MPTYEVQAIISQTIGSLTVEAESEDAARDYAMSHFDEFNTGEDNEPMITDISPA